MKRFFLSIVFATSVSFVSGCISKPVVPIEQLEYRNPHAGSRRKLMIFLRGFGGGHEVFKKKGLVAQVVDRKLPFDMVAPAAHFGYYQSETLGLRIHEDIVRPARLAGYEEVWLAGTSMGGLGALFYLIDYPDSVDGVILLSPFLGWGGIRREIKKAGGLQKWDPGPHTVEDYQRYLWAWLKRTRGDAGLPPIYLGYGDDDFFVKSQTLLAHQLPPDQVIVVDGGHSYGTLKRLWGATLVHLDEALRR